MGTIHYISAIAALCFGTWVLVNTKGTKTHKTIGFCYVISMFIMLASSFMSYNLNGKFGFFHIASIFASLTLLAGMLPVWFKRPRQRYRIYHLHFMYWSIIGLYMALAAEVFTRLPSAPFYPVVVIASSVVLVFGAIGFKKKVATWEKRFGKVST